MLAAALSEVYCSHTLLSHLFNYTEIKKIGHLYITNLPRNPVYTTPCSERWGAGHFDPSVHGTNSINSAYHFSIARCQGFKDWTQSLLYGDSQIIPHLDLGAHLTKFRQVIEQSTTAVDPLALAEI